MPTPDTNQAAHVAFTSTVASALARSIRDTPLRPLPAQAEALVASAQIVVAPEPTDVTNNTQEPV